MKERRQREMETESPTKKRGERRREIKLGFKHPLRNSFTLSLNHTEETEKERSGRGEGGGKGEKKDSGEREKERL